VILNFSKGKVTRKGGGGQISGEKMPGDLDSWNLYQQDINEALSASYGVLSQRSSSLYNSYQPAKSAINKTTAYAIGSGNIFRSRPDYRILGITPDEAKEWGKKFQLLVHYHFKKMSWYEKQAITFKGALIKGDSLVFFVREKDNSFDLVEAGGENIDFEKADNKNWTLGIKHDKWKRKQAIFTDKQINFRNQKTGDQQVIQFYLKEQPRQLRGLSLVYSIIAMAKNHDREIDATVQRAVLESIMMAYSNADQTDVGAQIKQQAQNASRKKGGLKNIFSKLAGTKDLQGGNLYQLKNDEKIQFTDLKTPGNNFDKFQDAMIKFVAMGTDTTPGIITSQYTTSYSSHKGELNDFWKMIKLKRGIFNEKVNKVVIREIAKNLIMDGKIKAPGFFSDPIAQEAWLSGIFLGPVPGQINPLQEARARAVEVENAFITRSDAASNYDNEFENMVATWAEQEIQFKTLPMTEQEKLIEKDLTNAK